MSGNRHLGTLNWSFSLSYFDQRCLSECARLDLFITQIRFTTVPSLVTAFSDWIAGCPIQLVAFLAIINSNPWINLMLLIMDTSTFITKCKIVCQVFFIYACVFHIWTFYYICTVSYICRHTMVTFQRTFSTVPLTQIWVTRISTDVHNSVKLTTGHGVDVITGTDDRPDRK